MVHAKPGSRRTDEPRTNNKRGRGRGARTALPRLPLAPSLHLIPLTYPMPPQPGVFPLPYASTSTHKTRANPPEIHNGTTDIGTSYPPPPHHTIHHPSSSALLAGPSSRPHGTFLLRSHCHILSRSFVASQALTPMMERRTEGARRS